MTGSLPLALISLLLSTSVFSSPLPAFSDLGARDETARRAFDFVSFIDVSLPLTYPTADTVWTAGSQVHITWNQSIGEAYPQSQVASTARLILGYMVAGSSSLNLDVGALDLRHLASPEIITNARITDNPLGTNIPLYNNTPTYSFTLPSNLPTRSTYILSFQGSSGNISPEFTINAISAVASSTSSTDAPAATTSSSTSSTSATETSSSSSEEASPTTTYTPTTPAVVIASPVVTSPSATSVTAESDPLTSPASTSTKSVSSSASTSASSSLTSTGTAASVEAAAASVSAKSGASNVVVSFGLGMAGLLAAAFLA